MAAGALLGAFGGQLTGAAVSYGLQKDAQRHQLRMMKNQKQWLYDDLRAAGINPILAAGAGQTAGGAGIASVSQGPDYGAAWRAGSIFKEQMAKAKADAGSARNAEIVSRGNAVYAESKRRYDQSPEGQAELRKRFSDENAYAPYRGLGFAGVGAGAASGLGHQTGKQLSDKDNWEWFDEAVGRGLDKGWNSGKDLLKAVDDLKKKYGPPIQEFYDERVGPYWKNKRKYRRKR